MQRIDLLPSMKKASIYHSIPVPLMLRKRKWSSSRLVTWPMQNIHFVTFPSSMETSFSARSYPVATFMPGGWCLWHFKLTTIRPTQAIWACCTALNSSPLWRTAILYLATMDVLHLRSCALQLTASSDPGLEREFLRNQLDTRLGKKMLTSWMK